MKIIYYIGLFLTINDVVIAILSPLTFDNKRVGMTYEGNRCVWTKLVFYLIIYFGLQDFFMNIYALALFLYPLWKHMHQLGDIKDVARRVIKWNCIAILSSMFWMLILGLFQDAWWSLIVGQLDYSINAFCVIKQFKNIKEENIDPKYSKIWNICHCNIQSQQNEEKLAKTLDMTKVRTGSDPTIGSTFNQQTDTNFVENA